VSWFCFKMVYNARVYEPLRLPAWLGLCDGRQVVRALTYLGTPRKPKAQTLENPLPAMAYTRCYHSFFYSLSGINPVVCPLTGPHSLRDFIFFFSIYSPVHGLNVYTLNRKIIPFRSVPSAYSVLLVNSVI